MFTPILKGTPSTLAKPIESRACMTIRQTGILMRWRDCSFFTLLRNSLSGKPASLVQLQGTHRSLAPCVPSVIRVTLALAFLAFEPAYVAAQFDMVVFEKRPP